jgi:peptidoglycan/xylan/chitin deacetylase (PgdA/CDA1 family)
MMRPVFSVLSPAGTHARLTTLIFHRVTPDVDPLFPEEMHARRFDELCAWIAGWFNVLPLDEAADRLARKALPARALCITFDDGYEDNCSIAMPILRRHGLTATFFIATGFLDGGRMWNDTVIESLRHASGDRLDLQGLPGVDLKRYPIASMADRREAIDQILEVVKYLPVSQRLEVVAEIARRASVQPRCDLMMSSQQVRSMRTAGMQIGAHTVTHPILAKLDSAAIEAELRQSKTTLEALLGEAVTVLAYPNGKPGRDYGPDSVEAARRLGFKCAVSTEPGVARAGSDVYQLPRFTPWDRTRLRFGARLAKSLLRT